MSKDEPMARSPATCLGSSPRYVLANTKECGSRERVEQKLQLEFLYECPSSSAIDDVAESVADIHSLQSKILLSLFPFPFVRTRLLTRAFPENERNGILFQEQLLHNRFLSPRSLRDHITSMEKALVVAHQQEALEPAGFDFQSLSEHQLHDCMQLWWAGKELASGKTLCDYIGPNEKTKVAPQLHIFGKP